MADNKAKVDTTLEAELAEYRKSVREEWDVPTDQLSQADIKKKTKATIVKNIPDAVGSIAFLAEYAESEQVKLSAAKFLVEHGLGEKGKSVSQQDKLDELIEKLTSGDAE